MERRKLFNEKESNLLGCPLLCSWLIIRLNSESVVQIIVLPSNLETIMIRLPEDFQSGPYVTDS
jgi:hypothetical protein